MEEINTSISLEERLEIIKSPLKYALTHYSEKELAILEEKNPFLYQKLVRKGLWKKVLSCNPSKTKEVKVKKERKRSSTYGNLINYYHTKFEGQTLSQLSNDHPGFYHLLLKSKLTKEIKQYLKNLKK
jgi:hypothetical protein